MSPLRNTRLIHPRWQAHHQPAVAGGMTATVRLSRPATMGTRNPETGKTPQIGPTAYYQGCGRVQARGGGTPVSGPAERDVTSGTYLVAVPLDLGGSVPAVDDLVDVLAVGPDGNPALAGLRLYVTEVPTSSTALQHNLGADLHQRPAADTAGG